MDTITHFVLHYQMTGQYLKEIQEYLRLHIYNFPRYALGLSEEDKSAFLLSMEERTKRLISRFIYKDLSFLIYLDRALHWKCKTFLQHKSQGELESDLFEQVSQGDPLYSQETSCKYNLCVKIASLLEDAHFSKQRKASFCKRIGFLILKNIEGITEPEFLAVMFYLGYCEDEALKIRLYIENSLEPKKQVLKGLIEKRNTHYFKLLESQKKISLELDLCKQELLKEKLTRHKKGYLSLCEKIKTYSLIPNNRDIAFVFHVPKGTVDSGIYYLRKYLEGLMPKTTLLL